MLGVIRLAAYYFAIVFAVGFILGTVRVLLLAPALGERWAELLELPVMLLACYVAAGCVVGRQSLGSGRALGVGMLALFLLLVAEFTLVLGWRGQGVAAYLSARDPVAGIAYAVALLAFALMPMLRQILDRRSLRR